MKSINKLLFVFIVLFSSTIFAQINEASLSDPHEPGELLIKIRRESLASMNIVNQELKLLGSIRLKTLTEDGLSLHKFSDEKDLVELTSKILEFDDVEYVELNHHHYLQAMPNDPMLGNQYGLINQFQSGADISASKAWSVTRGSRGVLVAVIDTGVDYLHPDLNSNYWVNTGEYGKDARGRDKRNNGIDDDRNGYIDDYKGWDFYSNDNDPMDRQGHGTHVAGIVGAKGNNKTGVSGVNWSVSLVGLKVFSDNGKYTRTDVLVSAINYATMMGISISNNSWGGGPYSRAVKEAISFAGSKGHLFVAASGNNGSNNDSRPFYPSNYNLSNIISVGATDSRDRLASFSNYGRNTVDIAAPGDDIYSTLPGGRYGHLSGTSMAAPYVTGVAALIKSRNSRVSASSLKSKILNGADKVKNLSDRVTSSRRLNAYRAVR